MLCITSSGFIYLIMEACTFCRSLIHCSHFHCPPLATTICSLWLCVFLYKHSYVNNIQYLSFFDLLHPVFLILEGNMVHNHHLLDISPMVSARAECAHIRYIHYSGSVSIFMEGLKTEPLTERASVPGQVCYQVRFGK